MDSILTSIKKLLGMSADYTHFDDDIIIHINSVLWRLRQLGVRDDSTFKITDDKQTWAELFGNREDLEVLKTYVYLKVKTIFDPPTSSFVLEAMKQQIAEYEWCLNVEVENNTES